MRVQATGPLSTDARPLRRILTPTPIDIPVSPVNKSMGVAPLPHEALSDPDSVNWSEPPEIPIPNLDASSRFSLFLERSSGMRASETSGDRALGRDQPNDHQVLTLGSRIRDRLRGSQRLLGRGRPEDDEPSSPVVDPRTVPSATAITVPDHWPQPQKLIDQLQQLSASTEIHSPPGETANEWATTTLAFLEEVLKTRGPSDAAADPALISLSDSVHQGLSLADSITAATTASNTRRTALALARRVAIWRAANALLAPEGTPESVESPIDKNIESAVVVLLDALERFEITQAPAEASIVKQSLATIHASPLTLTKAITQSVSEHYFAPNVRIALHKTFLENLLPEATVKTGPLEDVVLGRKIRGTRTVEQTTAILFRPDPDEICFDLEVHGDIASRTITETGPVAVTARTASAFTVLKPIKISTQGLLFGAANGVASNRSKLDTIQTSFDSVPVVRSLVRTMVKSQHEDSIPDVNREVIDKIISRACREVDEQAEPKFIKISERIRTQLWKPLVQLGLEPTPVALETTASVATLRLRLAADTQLAAHTPRPRAPSDAQLSMQINDSSLNNAIEQFGFAGQQFSLEALIRRFYERLGIEPIMPPDLPEGVTVTFASLRPLRIECQEGLVHVSVAIDAIESGRRSWHDIIAHVAYKLTPAGPQIFLEREGPVQLSGQGHHGRMEIALRTIFGKIFPKERPIPLLPDSIAKNPRLADMQSLQAVSTDGWFAIALGKRDPAADATATQPPPLAPRKSLFR